MEKLLDKTIVAACCLTAFLTIPVDAFSIGGFLVAVAVCALCEAAPHAGRIALGVAYAVAALAFPILVAFLPLVAYDEVLDESWPVRVTWAIPLAAALRAWEAVPWMVVALLCAVACVLARRTASLAAERDNYRRLRDANHEASMALEARNRDLLEAQDLSVQVATLAERGRIAREIHDNVGHLLTRAIMQVEALKVVHAGEPAIAAEFDSVAITLNEAMQTVRASVHDLRDEAIDPESLMRVALESSGIAHAKLVYEADELPVDVARCFIAIVREAATNTVRHSDATHIEAQVHEYTGMYQLVVQDNGGTGGSMASGSNGDAGAGGAGDCASTGAGGVSIRARSTGGGVSTGGMGLQAMEDRVRALGGTFRTDQTRGFRILATVPKPSENPQEKPPQDTTRPPTARLADRD